jgi:hypothetical protein
LKSKVAVPFTWPASRKKVLGNCVVKFAQAPPDELFSIEARTTVMSFVPDQGTNSEKVVVCPVRIFPRFNGDSGINVADTGINL